MGVKRAPTPLIARRPRTVWGKLAAWILSAPYAWTSGVVLVTAIGALLAMRLVVDGDLLALLPADDPNVAALHELDREEGGANLLTIAVTGPDQPTVDGFLGSLQLRVESLPEVRYALYRIDPELMHRIALMQLPVDELDLIRNRLRAAIALGPAARNPFIASRLDELGPLTEKLAGHVDPQLGSFGSLPNAGRLLVRPTGSAHDIAFSRQLMDDVQAAIEAENPASKGVEVRWIGGVYHHGIQDFDGLTHDIRWTSIPGFLLLSLAILVGFRDWRPVVVIVAPQVVGTVLTLGFAQLAIGSMSLFTSFAIVVLIGLGNDYGIVLFSRYRESLDTGSGRDDAVIYAWDKAGGAALTAAFTAAAAFVALFAARFAGFQQLGLMIGAGVVLCFASMIVMMPLLIRAIEPNRPTGKPAMLAPKDAVPSYRFAAPALIGGLLLTIAAASALPRLAFDSDLTQLRREGRSYAELSPDELRLAHESYSPILVSYTDEASLARDDARIRQEIADGAFPEISGVVSVRTLIPADAHERATVLAEIAAMAADPSAVYLPDPVRANLERLVALSPEQPDYELRATDLPDSLQNMFGVGMGHPRMLLIPSGNMWDLREAAVLGDALKAHLPGRNVAGEYLAFGLLYRTVRTDAPGIVLVACLLVALLVWIDLRSLRRAGWALVVQACGMTWAGGLLAAAGVHLNPVNFVAIPILVGTGVETSIFLAHRLREEGRGGIGRALRTTGVASGLCTVTTLLAFASLTLADSRGVRSLGEVILVGDVAVVLAAFLLLPAGAAFRWRLRRNQPLTITPESTPAPAATRLRTEP
jgi:predicted RND superfamily exporter protein